MGSHFTRCGGITVGSCPFPCIKWGDPCSLIVTNTDCHSRDRPLSRWGRSRMTTESAAPKLDKNDPDAIVRPYRFALKPTASQERKLRQHTGASRFVYNYLISQWRDDIHTRAEEKERDIPEDELTPFSFKTSTYDMRNYWNHIKGGCAPWYSEVSKEIGNDAARHAHDSIENWHNSKSGKRKGRRVGFPRFHKRGSHESCTFTAGVIRVNPDRRSVTLTKIGTIRTYENTRKLQRKIAKGAARITQATISKGLRRWYVSFTVYERKRISETHRNPGSVVGVDMGVGDHVIVAATPSGDEVMRRGLPKSVTKNEARIRHLQRKLSRKQGPDKRTKTTPSNRWIRANNQVNKYRAKLANIRRDFAAKSVHELAENYETIVVEDLNVQSMMTCGGVYKRGLNRAIAQASFADLRRRITYKTRWNGGTTIVADRWFPSSKTCSECGEVKSKLSLSERKYMCHCCGICRGQRPQCRNESGKIGGTEIRCQRHSRNREFAGDGT